MDNDNIHSAYRGDIFYADLEPVCGSEQGGVRPVLIMVNQSTEKKNTRQIQLTIEGHKVTISFAQEANPTLSALVRNTLLDAYIRKNGLCSEEQPA